MSDEISIQKIIVAKIQELAPKLTTKDVEDLLDIAARGKEEQLKKILSNYKLARKLNKPTTKNILDFINGLNPLFNFAKALGGLFGL